MRKVNRLIAASKAPTQCRVALQFDLRLGSDSDQRGLRAVAGCDSETQAADGNYRYKRRFVMVALNVSTRGRLHSVGHSSLNFSGMNLDILGDLLDPNQVSRLMLALPFFYGFDS